MRPSTKRTTSLAAVPLLVAGAAGFALSAPAAAETGSAQGTALDLALQATLLEQQLLNERLVLADTTAPAGGGTDEDEVLAVPIDEDLLGLDVRALRSSATRADDDLTADADVATAELRLADTQVLRAEVLSAEAVCPVDGDPSADAQLASLLVGDEAIDLDVDAPGEIVVPLDLDIEGVADVDAIVEVAQIERADATSADATALLAHIGLRATLADTEVVDLDVGEIALASASCTTATSAGDGSGGDDGTNGDDGDAGDGLPGLPGDDGDDANGDDDDAGDGLPGLPGDDGDDANGDDGDVGDGLPGLPGDDDATDGGSADALVPDEGPTSGGTEVTIEGDDLDQADTVTIDGDEVDITVSDEGTEATFTTPGGDEGEVDVVVTFDDGTTDTLTFTYLDPTEVAAGATEADGDATAGDVNTDGAAAATTAAGAGDDALPRTGNEAAIGSALGLLLLAAGSLLMVWRRDQTLTA